MLEASDSLVLAMAARFAPIIRGIPEVMGSPKPNSTALACTIEVLAVGLLAAACGLTRASVNLS